MLAAPRHAPAPDGAPDAVPAAVGTAAPIREGPVGAAPTGATTPLDAAPAGAAAPADPTPFNATAAAGPAGAAAKAPVSERGHPPGLYLLFTTEMWERMSFYGMRSLLTLYMTRAKGQGGFGWSDERALEIYSWYLGLVFMTPILGGYLADRYLGQRRAATIGAVIIIAAQFVLTAPGVGPFFAGLGLLIVGNGFFKANISTMVGQLYAEGDRRRDRAFTLFYMGINGGAVLGAQICGYLGERVGFAQGFASAGVGMALGLAVFALGAPRLLGPVGLEPSVLVARRRAGAAGAAPLGPAERDRVRAILVLSFFSIFFWFAFEQAGGLTTLFTDKRVDRVVGSFEVPTSWFQSLNSLFVVALSPVASAAWGALGRRGLEPPTARKFALGLFFVGAGYVMMLGASAEAAGGGKASPLWVVGLYFLHTLGELCLSPIGLSMVTKLAPTQYASVLMGTWFVANFIGNKTTNLAKGIGGSDRAAFVILIGSTLGASALLVALSKPLTRWSHGRALAHKPWQTYADASPSTRAASGFSKSSTARAWWPSSPRPTSTPFSPATSSRPRSCRPTAAATLPPTSNWSSAAAPSCSARCSTAASAPFCTPTGRSPTPTGRSTRAPAPSASARGRRWSPGSAPAASASYARSNRAKTPGSCASWCATACAPATTRGSCARPSASTSPRAPTARAATCAT
jgi:POT family proton-dependent oligopeptide transporter